MSLRARKPFILSFVLGALALGAVMVYSFGGRDIFAPHATFLVYFDETVSGLVPGSLVKFKGVPVGEVKSIRLDYRTSTGDHRIPVLIQINVDRLQHKLGVLEDVADPEVLANRVKRGLRAELDVERYVTGLMYVELDFHTPPPPFVPTTPPSGLPIYGVIPTVPSEAVADLKEAQDVITWLPTFDFKGEIEKVGDQIDSATNVVAAIPYAKYNQAIQRTLGPLTRFNFPAWDRNFNNFFNRLDRYQTAIGEANEQFYAQSQDFVAMNGQARGQLGQFDAKLAALRSALSANDPSMSHLTHNFEQLSKDLQNLTNKLDAFEQQPGVLDRMTPPDRSK
jgi:paraquat-inducible protein B